MVLGLGLASTYVFAKSGEEAERTTIPQGISIAGVDVSGMTLDEANEVVADYLAQYDDAIFVLEAGDNFVWARPSDIGLTARNSDVAERALNYGLEGNILERYAAARELEDGSGHDFSISLAIDEGTASDYLEEKSSTLDIPCTNATLKHTSEGFSFIEGTAGREVQIAESVSKIQTFVQTSWTGENAELELVVEDVEPEGTAEELSVIQDLLGTYTTDYHTSSSARKTNVANGASKLNGLILYPGETISVAETVNPMTAENGYALAGSYENGTTVETYGGGICQVSTTLYNAVMRAELEIVTRSAHSMIVSYVEPSMDAAIAGTSKDFQFKNNQDYPVYIEGITDGNTITFNVYGVETRDSNRVVTFESEITSETAPAVEFVAAADQPIGYAQRTQKSHTGYTARLWKIVTVDGVETERRIYNNSRYNVSNEVRSIGIASASPEATAAMNAAIATQDEATINAAIAKYTGATAATTDTTQDATQDTTQVVSQ